LDVDGVFTGSGSGTSANQNAALKSIDVEPVRQRDRSKLRRLLPDLRPVAVTCVPPDLGNFPEQIDIEIENIGEGDATSFETLVRFGDVSMSTLLQPQLESGKRTTLSLPIPEKCRFFCKVDVIVDFKGTVDESNEHNNQGTNTCLPLPG
jgi:subtilase family serine protease